MIFAALRDLQWRRRRIVIAIVGTGLVFAMSLLMSGLANSFSVEVNRTLDRQGAQAWVILATSPGAFSPGSFLLPGDVAAIIATTGPQSTPVLYGSAVADLGRSRPADVSVMGIGEGGLAQPSHLDEGDSLLGEGKVSTPRSLGLHTGDQLSLSGRVFTVSGVVDTASVLAGLPLLQMDLADAQGVLVGGQPVVSTVLTTDANPTLPAEYRTQDKPAVARGLMRPLKNAVQSIQFVKALLWLVAALVLAAVVYLGVLDRTRDIAVFKATGASTAAVGAGVCVQAVVVAVLAAVLGVGLGVLLAPRFPMQVDIESGSMMSLPLLAMAIGMLAGMLGVRRVAGIEPVTAFGGP